MKRTGDSPVPIVIVAIGAFVGFLLLRMGTGSAELNGIEQGIALMGGLAIWLVALAWLFRTSQAQGSAADDRIPDSVLGQFLFASRRSAPLWLGARLFLGYEWFEAGRGKLTSDAWMSGASLEGFWQNAAAVPEGGRPAITYDWYRETITYMLDHGWAPWFADVVAWGEVLIGVGLAIGALTGVAAFFGALLNMSFMLAGSASTNPVLFTLSILIILAWRVAGWIGVDRFLLPLVGAPWAPGRLVRKDSPTSRGKSPVAAWGRFAEPKPGSSMERRRI